MSFYDAFDETPAPTERATVTPIRPVRTDTDDDADGAAYALAALADECDKVAAMGPNSGRNVALNNAALRMGQLVGAGAIDLHTVKDALKTAGRHCGLADHEIDRVLRDKPDGALQVGQKSPRQIPERTTISTPPTTVIDVPSTDSPDSVEWRAPDPLVNHPLDFPLEILGWLKPAAEALTEELQTPPDLVGMLILAAIAATVRGRARVKITANWHEPLNLYVALVLGAGETKSPALSRIVAPIRQIEKELQDWAKPQISAAEQRRRLQEKRVRSAEEKAVKADGGARATAEYAARAEQEELDAMEVPALPRLLAGDITPEGLVRLLAEQGGVMASLTAEGGLFDTFAGGRYSNGMANLDAILQAHDGREPILVDRKVGDPIRIERPCLTLGLAVQPQVIESIGENAAAQGRGLLARWLFAVPRSRVGTRRVVYDGPADGFAGFADAVIRLNQRLDGGADLLRLSSADSADGALKGFFELSPSSSSTHNAYRADLECRRHPETGDLADLGGWASKLDGQIARLATLLHLIDLLDPHSPSRADASAKPAQGETSQVSGAQVNRSAEYATSAEPHQVSDDAMWRAITLAEYLIEHARAAHLLMSPAEGPHAGARQLLGWIKSGGHKEFSVRDAFNALRGRVIFHRAEAIQDAAIRLAAAGYLVQLAPDPTPKPGRPPSPRYLVNPAILGGGQ